jgi:hypothetical protein
MASHVVFYFVTVYPGDTIHTMCLMWAYASSLHFREAERYKKHHPAVRSPAWWCFQFQDIPSPTIAADLSS